MLKRALAATMIWCSAGTASAASADPAAVFAAYNRAVNAGDMPAIVAMIADDPAPTPFAMCRPGQSNRECLIAYIDRTVGTTHTVLTPIAVHTTGDTIEAKLEVRNDLTRAAGIDRLAGTDKIQVRDGKIVSFAFLRDEADPQTAKFFAYMRSTMGPPPGGPPSGPPAPGGPPR